VSQYKIGTVSVTSASATATGVGTAWLANAAIGDYLVVQDSSLSPAQIVAYEVGGVVSDVELTLTAPYGGTTGSGFSYVAHRDYHPNGSPKFANGDVETAAIQNRWNSLTQATTALGTDAFVDSQTSNDDATSGRGLLTGAGGVLNTSQLISHPDVNADTPSMLFTALNSGANAGKLPSGEDFIFGQAISRGVAGLDQATLIGFNDVSSGDPNIRAYIKGLNVDTDSGWKELYHTGNLNQFEFGAHINRYSAEVRVLDDTSALISLPINEFNIPSSFSVDLLASFSIVAGSGAVLSSGITAGQIVSSGVSDSRLFLLVITGLIGMNAYTNATLYLKPENATSKIMVIPS
jgi:hypothetical protein